MAGALITSAIPVIIFIFLGRYFISGLMADMERLNKKVEKNEC